MLNLTSAKVAFVGLAAAGLSLALLIPANAAQPVSQKVREACRGDYMRLCPSYPVGSTAMRACMERRGLELSSRCVDALIQTGEISRSEVLATRTKKN